MKLYKFLFFLFATLFLSTSCASNRLVHYKPEIVKLSGLVKIETFPGPPNYESIKNGDAIETGAYLKLDLPVDVNFLPNDENDWDGPEKNVEVVQLVVYNDAFWKKIIKGNHVRLTGTLFHAMNGHHHARVLLEVQHVLVLENPPEPNRNLKNVHAIYGPTLYCKDRCIELKW